MMRPDPSSIDTYFYGWAAFLGALIGIGQVIESDTPLTWRIVLGRAFVTAGLAAIAPVFLVWFPTMPRMAEFAIAAAFASLGKSGLEWVIVKVLRGSRK